MNKMKKEFVRNYNTEEDDGDDRVEERRVFRGSMSQGNEGRSTDLEETEAQQPRKCAEWECGNICNPG